MSSAQWSRACIDRYSALLSATELRRRVNVYALPLNGLDAMPIALACEELQQGLERVFLLTDQGCALLLDEIERAHAHAIRMYSETAGLIPCIYASRLGVTPCMPTLITGPAGGGKSVLCKALGRALSGTDRAYIDPEHRNMPLKGIVEIVVKGRSSIIDLLRPVAYPSPMEAAVKVKQAELPALCAKRLRLCGVCLLSLDETQFLTHSANATALITSLLMAIAQFGVPWIVNANYSLCWKLLARPSEMIQRLLGRPRVLMPDPPQSPDWQALLAEYQTVLSNVLAFRLIDRSTGLWSRCGGIKRLLVRLLRIAYKICRNRGGTRIVWEDVTDGYQSNDYYLSRLEVEKLVAAATAGEKLSPDLKCPFPDGQAATPTAAYEQAIRAKREDDVAKSKLDACRNASEAQQVERMNAAASSTGAPARPGKSRRRYIKPRRVEDLLDAGRRRRTALDEER